MIVRAFRLILLLLLFSKISWGQESKTIQTRNLQKDLANTFAFLYTQDYTIERLRQNFPQHVDRIELVNLKFYRSFGDAIDRIYKEVSSGTSKDSLEVFTSSLITKFSAILSENFRNESFCLNFILEMEKRADGSLPSPVLETLLYYQYINIPEKEFLDGFKYTFRTAGHKKSKGTDWQIEVPKSWTSEEGLRPDIIRKFTSRTSNGLAMITMSVDEISLEKGEKPSESGTFEMFSEKKLRNLIPNGAKFISGKRITVDGHPGAVIEMEQIGERIDQSAKIIGKLYIFTSGNRIYFLQCLLTSTNPQEDMTILINKYNKLFGLIANSIVEFQQYKK